jgi:hypothetical protein
MGIIYNMDTPLLGEKHDGTVPNVQPADKFKVVADKFEVGVNTIINEPFQFQLTSSSTHSIQKSIDDLTIKLDTLILKSNTTSSYDLLNTLLNKITRLEMKYEDMDKRLSEFQVITVNYDDIVNEIKQEESVEEVDDDATEENTED